MHQHLQLSVQLGFAIFFSLINVQENLAVNSEFALDQVSFSPKEQNLPMLFNEGENSQVTNVHAECAAVHWDKPADTDVTYLTGFTKRLCEEHHVDI